MNIRIVSPSATIDPKYIDGAKQVLESWGHQVSIASHAKGRYGGAAGTKEERLQDLNDAFAAPEVDAILCSRGGYGLAQIVDKVQFRQGKLLLGFSDITCLHCLCANHNTPSLHSIMAKHIATLPEDSEPMTALKAILNGGDIRYCLPTDPRSRQGKAKGILRGGNLAVFGGLQGTPLEVKKQDTVLFIEDVTEPHYRVDRMLQNLRMSGLLASCKAFIVGQFTDCEDDPRLSCTLEENILGVLREYDIPLLYNFPAGHVDYNLPLMLNHEVEIEIGEQHTILTQILK